MGLPIFPCPVRRARPPSNARPPPFSMPGCIDCERLARGSMRHSSAGPCISHRPRRKTKVTNEPSTPTLSSSSPKWTSASASFLTAVFPHAYLRALAVSGPTPVTHDVSFLLLRFLYHVHIPLASCNSVLRFHPPRVSDFPPCLVDHVALPLRYFQLFLWVMGFVAAATLADVDKLG